MTVTTYPELEQGSQDWLDARCGILTASQIGKLLTPTLKVAENDTSRNLTLTLAAERITKHVEYVHPSFDMMRGQEEEPLAREAYAAHKNVTVDEVGFYKLEQDGYTIGFSPDGVIGSDGLLEIKSRNPRIHLSTIFADKVPNANLMQIQCGLLVAGRSWLDYVSFSPGLPLFVKRVYPDPAAFEALIAAAQKFEVDVAEIITKYGTATKGMPATERRPELEEMRF